ncbi:Tn3 family transposase [uncultured Rhizobium sp.]|uniref:Tn3 family transposase n=1 Tax=uncultured Rhizobium sp. TaxID=155567 RepID=UPI00345CB911
MPRRVTLSCASPPPAAGSIAPSQILRKLASYPRQNELATALREAGRVERTLFMIDWILDAVLYVH